MCRGRPIILFVALLSLAFFAGAGEYEAKWESLDRRPVPQWWRDAKFGIFVHWGPYSVPAYAPTALPGAAAWTLRIETEDGAM